MTRVVDALSRQAGLANGEDVGADTQRAESMFRRVDLDGDGYLSLDEIRSAIKTEGVELSEGELKEAFDKIDTNRDGKVDMADGKVDMAEFHRAIGLLSPEIMDNALTQWLSCIGVLDALAQRLPRSLVKLNGGKKDLDWGKTLGEVKMALVGMEEELASIIHGGVEDMRSGKEAVTSAEAANSKFAAESSEVAQFEKLEVYTKGLDEYVGLPEEKVYEAMQREHCEGSESDQTFTTSNYGIKTTSKQEWDIVVNAEAGQEYADGRRGVELSFLLHVAGVEDSKDVDENAVWLHVVETTLRHALGWPELDKALGAGEVGDVPTGGVQGFTRMKVANVKAAVGKKKEEDLDRLVEEQLQRWKSVQMKKEEVIALRLYTGPMYQKYNGLLRQGGKDAHNVATGFTTTLHAINSGLLKLQKVTVAPGNHKLYRGLSGRSLPKEFWEADVFGFKGGVEKGFLSTTTKVETMAGK